MVIIVMVAMNFPMVQELYSQLIALSKSVPWTVYGGLFWTWSSELGLRRTSRTRTVPSCRGLLRDKIENIVLSFESLGMSKSVPANEN